MDHGSEGFPYSCRMEFVMAVYLSSESMRSPSISKRHARTGGRLAFVSFGCLFT